MNDDIKKIRKIYYAFVIPGLITLLVLNILRKYAEYTVSIGHTSQLVSLIIIIIAALSAFIIPLIITKVSIRAGKINAGNYAAYQKKILFISLPSLYIAILGYILPLPGAPGIIVTMFALFALYYYFPSDRRIMNDRKKFGITE